MVTHRKVWGKLLDSDHNSDDDDNDMKMITVMMMTVL